MTETSINVVCSDCGEIHSPGITSSAEIKSCPVCESSNQSVSLSLSDRIEVTDQLKVTAQDPTLPSNTQKKRHQTEIIQGSEWSVSHQKMVHKERLIDKPNNKYTELVVDPDTGEIIHWCEEPLSHHTGHGDAKASE